MKKNLEIISLIYKSISYLNLIVSELKKDYCKLNGWDVGMRIVANDATSEVITALKDCGIAYSIYKDKDPAAYYLNRVYRCWNYSGSTSEYDNICFVNSDMVFSDGWLDSLVKHHDGINIPCSRLVESGKLLSGKHAIGNTDFGKNPLDIKYEDWYNFAEKTKEDRVMHGGLFMPCVFNTSRFIESGMYPEGNIYRDGRAGSMIGGVTMSGDDCYFRLLQEKYGMKHITVFNSLTYHIQEGERDS